MFNLKALVFGGIGSLMFASSAVAGEVFVYNQHSTGNFKVNSVTRSINNEVYIGGNIEKSRAYKFEVLDHKGSFASSSTMQVEKQAYMGESASRTVTRQNGYVNTYEHRVGSGTN